MKRNIEDYRGKVKSELKEMLAEMTQNEIIDLLWEALKPAPEAPKITLTQAQFEQHFQLSNDSGKRGRPRKIENVEIVSIEEVK